MPLPPRPSPASPPPAPISDGEGRLACLVGPTASGKSALALELAERHGAEIVSLDSMQVYRRMDVGTAKPTAAERSRAPHHMLDRVEPSERYDVQAFLRDLRAVAADLAARRARALFVGGTGFYLKAVLDGLFEGPPLDRELRAQLERRFAAEGGPALHAELARADAPSAARIHPHDAKRLVRALEVLEQTGRPLSDWQREWGWHGRAAPASDAGREVRLVGLAPPLAELDRRIARRTAAMLDAGWAEEAAAVRAGPGFGPTAIQALGYREALELYDGRLERAAAEERIAQRTRRFARRQGTWYRKFPELRWVAPPAGAAEREAVLAELAAALGLVPGRR